MEATILIRLPLAVRDKYKRSCKKARRSMNAQTHLLIEEWIKAQK